MDAHDEWDLIRRCRGGSTAAYEPLVRAHEGGSLAFARALLGDADEAEDAVQEAFVRAYRSLGRLAEGSAFGPWLRSILRNLCLDRLRSPRRRQVEWTAPGVEARLWREPEAVAALERQELAASVQRALLAISPEHRAVLAMKEMEEMSYAEIAGALGISPGTVASRLHHARAALRRVLAGLGVSLEDVPR